jgi:hypothetical protein
MHRSKGRRRSAARIIGWGLVAMAYAVVLVWASGLTAGDAAVGEAAQAVAGTVVAAAAPAASTAAVIHTPAEAPLVTLGLAAAIVFAAATWYVVHTFRARHPRMRSARLIVRHITTLI